MAKDLNELIEIKKAAVKANMDANIHLKGLLADMYSERAHFIYELLQNAEDKEAKNVNFIMHKDKLIFEHDGGVYNDENLFNLKDIDAITGVSFSTKSNNDTKIGKFGVGFKAVFAYTETPQIFSGDFAFEIDDLIVPKIIDKAKDLKNGYTRFVFPFNSKTKRYENIITEIKHGLVNIKDNTLLFLKNIENISYEIFDGENGEYLRIDEENNEFTLVGKGEETHWLRFDKDVRIYDEEDRKDKDCIINIAFRLNISDGIKEIIPLKNVDKSVSIYFPAEKEVSNLRFILNAPFASVTSRDSIRDCDSNKSLIKEFSVFIKEVLEKISKMGYMKMNFLKVLPNKEDNISEIYWPIFQSVYDEYKTKPYFIIQDGGLDYLNNVVKAYRVAVYELFSTEDINYIFDKQNLKWLKNPALENSLESKFLNMFNIKVVTAVDLLCKNKSIEKILKLKDDNWFYKLLKQLNTEYKNIEDLDTWHISNAKIIPTGTGEILSPKECFYINDESECEDVSNIVKPSIYTDKSNKVASDNISTLEKIGVRKFDSKIQIQHILKKYRTGQVMSKEDNIKDVRNFFKLMYSLKYDYLDLKHEILETKFIYTKNGELSNLNNMILGVPYIDKPSFYELLSEKIDINAVVMTDIYNVVINKFFKEKIVNVCNRLNNNFLNIYSDLQINEYTYGGPIGRDYYIPFLDEILRVKDITISLLLWNFLVSENIKAYSKHKENGIVQDSELISKLKKYSWLPNKFGEFCKPDNIYIEDLPKEFKRTDFYLDLIDILGIKSRSLANEKLEESLNELGSPLSISEIYKLGQMKQDHPEKFDEFVASDMKFNKEKRKSENEIEALTAREVKSEEKTRSVRTSESKIDAKSYLRNFYYKTGRDIIVCQICHHAMPFRKKDKNWYFEDVEMFKNSIVEKSDECTHIALCPICSAKYKEYLKNDEEKQLNIIKEILYKKNHEIFITLDEKYALWFNEKHYFDLQTKIPLLINEDLKSSIENEHTENQKRKLLSDEIIKASYINCDWVDINKETIKKIGYDSINRVMFVDYDFGVEYFEQITKIEFKDALNSENISSIINNLKNFHYSTTYKIK